MKPSIPVGQGLVALAILVHVFTPYTILAGPIALIVSLLTAVNALIFDLVGFSVEKAAVPAVDFLAEKFAALSQKQVVAVFVGLWAFNYAKENSLHKKIMRAVTGGK